MATELDIIQRSGAWFSYNGERLGQGRDKIKEYMAQNPEFRDEIERQVKERFNLKKSEVSGNSVVENDKNEE